MKRSPRKILKVVTVSSCCLLEYVRETQTEVRSVKEKKQGLHAFEHSQCLHMAKYKN